MNTIENNKLIAEFMGYQILGVCCNTYPKYEEVENLPMLEDMFRDWNELMEVVEKIEDIQDGEDGDSFRQHLHDVTIRQHVVYISNTDIEVAEYGSKLLNTYNAVVEFIKWYNTQKL
jgi:hypothetical protein